ncbi:MAG: ABC transporter substrate-binding protein [Chloroflexota bacterium]
MVTRRSLPVLVLIALVISTSFVAAQDDETTLVITSISDISSLDPAIGYDTLSWPTVSLTYRGLVTYDDNLEDIVPALAESFDISEDGLEYTFTLREGVMFSNGREIVPEDVVYTFERVLAPETASPGAFMFESIAGSEAYIAGEADSLEGIEIVDERTVRFTLSFPEYTFIQRMTLPFASLVPQEEVERLGEDFARNPVGAGPFTLESYDPGLQYTFVRNPNYYREGFPVVDRVEIQIGVDASTSILRIESGEADVSLDVVPNADYPRIVQDDALSENLLPSQAFPNIIYLTVDTRSEPLNDVMVREALSMAIDRERLTQLLNNRAIPAAGPIPPIVQGDNPDLVPDSFDPEGAAALLAEAGYPDGLTTEIYTYTDPTLTSVAQAIAQDWSEAGVTAEVITLDFAPLLDLAFSTPEELPVMLIDWYYDYQDPSNTYQPLVECGGSFNVSGYCNEAMDAVEDEAKVIPFSDERWAAYAELEGMVAEELPIIPLYHVTQYYYTSARVDNIASHPSYILNFETISISE